MTGTTEYDGLVVALRAAGCVFAEDEAALLIAHDATAAERARLVARRVAGEPLEHLLGWAEFGGRRIAVGPGVFVPRRRTELLAEQALVAVAGLDRAAVVVELCCGAGAVAAVVAGTHHDAEVWVTDVDPVAVAFAGRNLVAATGVPAGVPTGDRARVGDLFAALPASLRGRVDVLVANAPYVPSHAIGSMPPEARDHEPHVSLDGGADGLDVVRRVVAEAPAWLSPEGVVMVEASEQQAPAVGSALEAGGLHARVVLDPEVAGCAVVANRPH